jgi:enolase
MATIKSIFASEILDSKGNPTIEATVILSDDTSGTAACPTGTSVGKYEAVDLRDHDESRYHGQGVLKAIDNINTIISPKIIGMNADEQQSIDRTMIELDGTQNKGHLGANATLSVSMAVAKAAAKSAHLPLYLYLRNLIRQDNNQLKIPTPLFNLINGGKHAGQNLDMQEFHVIPASFKTYPEGLHIGASVYRSIETILQRDNMTTLIGDEGGFAPTLATNEDALKMLGEAVAISNLRLGYDVFLGMDCAADNYYDNKKYIIKDKGQKLTSQELISFYAEIAKRYHILYLEDPLSEDDWDGWSIIGNLISNETLIVGDDLTATNPFRLQMAITKKAISGIIIKPNQIGTVIEALAVVEVAKQAGLKIVVSHRSGETNDDFIADLAVAVSADYMKFGAPARGERVAKYNRLLEIDRQLKAL